MKNDLIAYAPLIVALLFSVSVALLSPGEDLAGIEKGRQKAEIPAEAVPPLTDILQNYIQALGGRDTLETIQTRVCRGRLTHDLSWKDPTREEIPFEASYSVPGKWTYREETSEGVYREGCDGRIHWQDRSGDVEFPKEKEWTKISFLLDPRAALRMEDYFHGMTVTGEDVVYGRRVFVVQPESLDVAHYSLYFDAETGLLIRIGYYDDLLEYRHVDGTMFPFRYAKSRKGGSSTYVFEEVKHNIPVDDKRFAPPLPPGK